MELGRIVNAPIDSGSCQTNEPFEFCKAEAIADAGTRRARRFRRLRKHGLEPIVLDLPVHDLLRAWCLKNDLPIGTPTALLPMTRIKNDLVDILIAHARPWLKQKSTST